ncbi:MAG: 3'(2'),5'-bisphosphate nucleotidase CysQ [Bacteroidota bacterium]
MEEKELLAFVIQAALEAGEAILAVYGSDHQDVAYKSDLSPLTLADRRSQEIILRYLAKTQIPVISEESLQLPWEVRRNWQECWIVDPLDGTKEYLKRNGDFTVNIALVKQGKPVLGVIFTPVTGELYFGTLPVGAYKLLLQGKPLLVQDAEMLFSVSSRLPLPVRENPGYTVVASRSHMSAETTAFIQEVERKFAPVRVVSRGSSLKICMVAEGTADVYPRFAPTMEWDTAAGHAIAKAAGYSLVNPETGMELEYNKESLLNPWFLVQKT